MFSPGAGLSPTKTTSHKVVLPFYVYASLSLLAASVLLLVGSDTFTGHHFHPDILAVTHMMALGWGSMMILGASHQLVPVMIEGKLYSNFLGYASFVLAAPGIILLVTGFYQFNFGWLARTGSLMVLAAFLLYFINLAVSMSKSKHENVHAVFVLTASLWVLVTMTLGVLLLFNFTSNILAMDSLHYLSLHAHLGIVGWFLLMVFGVGTRLIPMFMISKYNNVKLIWWMFGLVNGGLLLFFVSFILKPSPVFYFVSIAAVLFAIGLFIKFSYEAYKGRLRKKLEPQLKISILSGWMMLLPAVIILLILLLPAFLSHNEQLILVYGFCIFFGWISAIIFGMTFKTLPFILWNKKFHAKAGAGQTPNPRELFSQPVFKWMLGFYFSGFLIFISGIFSGWIILLKVGAAFIILTAILFNTNVYRMLRFKSTSK